MNSRKWLAFAFTASLFFLFHSGCAGETKGGGEKIELMVNGTVLEVEVARSEEERARGLMGRKSLAPKKGMLFVFDRDKKLSFWMKNTSIPLSIAFISKEGVIKEIRDMEPYSLNPVVSAYSVRYALEVNQGEFLELGIRRGDKITFPRDFP